MTPAPSEPTPFQRFEALAREVVIVPKAEIDHPEAEDKNPGAKKK
jgi:hypothetical protein